MCGRFKAKARLSFPEGQTPGRSLKERAYALYGWPDKTLIDVKSRWAMPTIDLTVNEHAAVTAAIRRTIEEDRFPHAPRLPWEITSVWS